MGAGTGTGTGRPPRNAAQRRPPAASATGTGSSTSSTDTGSTGSGSTGSSSITGSSTGGTGTCGLRRSAAPRRQRRGSPTIPCGQPTCPPLALDASQLVPGTPQRALGVLQQPCEFPNSSQGTTCLEGGSFLLNFVGCAQCGRRDFVLVSNRAEGLQDGEEIVTYDHLCKNCHHLIARHEYTFSVVDDYQEYTMLCLLCGRAEDSISILPDDPRQMTPLF